MNDIFRRAQKAIFIAVKAGLISALIYFILDASAAFLVTGDGYTNAFTKLMLSLRKILLWLFGKNIYGSAVSGSLFCGVLIGVGAFLYFFKKNKSN